MERINVPVEVRSSDSGPKLHGVILTEGRAAVGGRAELFAPGACIWPDGGIGIGVQHHNATETRTVPIRDGTEIRIEAEATPALFRAVNDGARYMSLEFHSLRETRTRAGIREVTSALVTGAIVTDDPEYAQTAAEVRTREGRRVWL